MTAQVLDGKAVAKEILDEVAANIEKRVAQGKPRPALVTIMVGDNPSSALYVTGKQKSAKQVGMDSQDLRLPTETTTALLLELVEKFNRDPDVSGILVQDPPPPHIDMTRVKLALDPAKDVDGFHPYNAGLMSLGFSGGSEPCTPGGIIELLVRAGITIEGKEAVVVGRSNLVGKPIALLLLRRNATVTICHTRTRDLAAHTKRADILVAAAGKLNLITKEMVKPGAAVIDVGANWVDNRQIGDLGPGVEEVAGWLTPNPGGVGPMTRAMLIKNTYDAEVRRRP